MFSLLELNPELLITFPNISLPVRMNWGTCIIFGGSIKAIPSIGLPERVK